MRRAHQDQTMAEMTKAQMAERNAALEAAIADFQRLYSTEWGGEGQTDATFCAAYERVWRKHRDIDLRTDDERPI